jgi:hypothetical protein
MAGVPIISILDMPKSCRILQYAQPATTFQNIQAFLLMCFQEPINGMLQGSVNNLFIQCQSFNSSKLPVSTKPGMLLSLKCHKN